jgi:hypothetical protein
LPYTVDFTPAWRHAGLPSRPSQLQVQAGKLQAVGLLDPKRVVSQHRQHQAKEVLSAPRVFEYNDAQAEPHHLQTTNNVKV